MSDPRQSIDTRTFATNGTKRAFDPSLEEDDVFEFPEPDGDDADETPDLVEMMEKARK